MTLGELDLDLSIKLGDPVNNNDDGKMFLKSYRIKYIERAYARLKRILPKLMLKESPLFTRIPTYEKIEFKSDETTQKKGTYIVTTKPIIDIYELYAIINNVSYPASAIKFENYISIKNGKNSMYNPNFETKEIYYLIVNEKIHLLPQEDNAYQGIEILYASDLDHITDTDTETLMSKEINIPTEYIDLLLMIAANEGMQDIARQDKVQLYTSDIIGQLNILTQYAGYQKQKDGTEVNG